MKAEESDLALASGSNVDSSLPEPRERVCVYACID